MQVGGDGAALGRDRQGETVDKPLFHLNASFQASRMTH